MLPTAAMTHASMANVPRMEARMKPALAQSEAELDMDWLRWNVEKLWDNLTLLEGRVDSIASATASKTGGWEDRLKLISNRLEKLEAQPEWTVPGSPLMQVFDSRLEKQMSAIDGTCSRLCKEAVHEVLQENFNRHVTQLDEYCTQLRAETKKEVTWLREGAQLETKLLSTMLRNLMLDVESARFEQGNKSSTEVVSPMTPRGCSPAAERLLSNLVGNNSAAGIGPHATARQTGAGGLEACVTPRPRGRLTIRDAYAPARSPMMSSLSQATPQVRISQSASPATPATPATPWKSVRRLQPSVTCNTTQMKDR